jgi:hypothetical protein
VAWTELNRQLGNAFAALAAGKQHTQTWQGRNQSAGPGDADNGDTEIMLLSSSKRSKVAEMAPNITISLLYMWLENGSFRHVTRTVAKSELEALHYRVVYSVRSKPPPKTTIFEALQTDSFLAKFEYVAFQQQAQQSCWNGSEYYHLSPLHVTRKW